MQKINSNIQILLLSKKIPFSTGKCLSEALIFVSTNPQYYNRLFIAHENYELRIPAEHVVYQNCSECQNKTKTAICVH